ncbi:MAG: hypothetical protein HY342_03020 [Candidatus Lambdaproteobacteria bacterium]|nr:hypothetical protein [Candidatus Lambdaproteobacteria bacterium]
MAASRAFGPWPSTRVRPLRAVRPRAWSLVLGLLAVLAVLPAEAGAQGGASEFRFDVTEFDKAPYSLDGLLELSAADVTLNPDGALYRLTALDTEQRSSVHPYGAKLQLEGGYAWPWLAFNFRVQASESRDELGSTSEAVVQEAYLATQPTATSTVELGKRVTKWGKGYAWNPVAFVDRAKDPSDPELAQEGFVMARAEVIRSFASDLRNVALSLVLLPVDGDVNEDFGVEPATNVAGKLTLLLWDTDIDLLALGGGTRPSRWGVDFSRNLGSNVEVHGEWTRTAEAQQPVLQPGGGVQQRVDSTDAWLLGLRYLTDFELTSIVEYYVNEAGYTREELENFYRFVDQAWMKYEVGGSRALLDRAASLVQGGYGRPNPGRRYGYLRLSQKDPFDWLYVTPAATAIANLDDDSRTLIAELGYTGITNLELRGRVMWLQGERFTEFAEKANASRAELRVQWHF